MRSRSFHIASSFVLLFLGFATAETAAADGPSKGKPPRQGWTPPPNKRGTIDILWSCLSTLFICIWASLHLNVPSDHEPPKQVFLRKLKWGFISALLPEVVTWFASRQCLTAWHHSLDMRRLGYNYWTITHSFAVLMGGIAITDTHGQNCTRVKVETFAQLAREWDLELPSANKHEGLPPLDLIEIRDKSKSSNVVKAVACLQVGWLVIQCIERRRQGLSITTLEIVTIAYSVNAFLVYSLWWKKPLDIQIPIRVKAGKVPTGKPRIRNWTSGDIDTFALSGLGKRDRNAPSTFRRVEVLLLRFFSVTGEGGVSVALLTTTTAFGVIHVAAWNSDFASRAEELLWRASSVMTSALPILIFATLIGSDFIDDGIVEGAFPILSTVLMVAYGICRSYLMVEPFVGLRSLPADAYDAVQWANFIPHIF